MQWVETTGRTVDEAKEAALDQLGIDAVDAEFEIVEEPKAGLFGRVRSEARVRARVKPRAPRQKERRERRRRGGRAGSPRGEGSLTAGEAEPGLEVEPDVEVGPELDDDDDEDERPAALATAERDRGESMVDSEAVVSLADQAQVAQAFLAGLTEEFGASATRVSIREIDPETVELVVDGDGLGLLIGPKGQTLEAVQELMRTVVQRQTGARQGRLLVDISGYRERRREALEKFTRQLADEVKGSGVRKLLEPMSPADRKVVHDTANTIDGVSTISEGEEPRRRVVLLPDAPS